MTAIWTAITANRMVAVADACDPPKVTLALVRVVFANTAAVRLALLVVARTVLAATA